MEVETQLRDDKVIEQINGFVRQKPGEAIPERTAAETLTLAGVSVIDPSVVEDYMAKYNATTTDGEKKLVDADFEGVVDHLRRNERFPSETEVAGRALALPVIRGEEEKIQAIKGFMQRVKRMQNTRQ